MVAASDCDDSNAAIGALLYENDLSEHTGYLQPTEELGDNWYWDGMVEATDGGQQALIGESESWDDVVVMADVAASDTEPGCTDCVVDTWRLFDHPDGSAGGPGYGLRLDGLFDGESGAHGGQTTFTFEAEGAEVWAQLEPETGVTRISGLVYGGEVDGAGYGHGEALYEVYFVYNMHTDTSDGVRATEPGSLDVHNHGWLRRVSDGRVYPLYDYNGKGEASFIFDNDGHRVSQSDDMWVGRGWLETSADREGSGKTRDFIFTARDITCDDRRYTARAYSRASDAHFLWFADFYGDGEPLKMKTDDAVFEVAGHTARLAGTAYTASSASSHARHGEVWDVTFTWEALGRGSKEGKIASRDYQPEFIVDNWEFFTLKEASLESRDTGATLSLTEAPADGRFPLQVGDGANNKNASYGASMWFDFTHEKGGKVVATGRGDINTRLHLGKLDCGTERWRAGVLARAELDGDQNEGYHAYRCAVARNAPEDCFDEGRFVQLAAFLDDAEDDGRSVECGDACTDPTFDQLARTDYVDGPDILNGDTARLEFWLVDDELACRASSDGELVQAEASGLEYHERGGIGLSTLNVYGQFSDLKVCEALDLP